MSVFPEWTLEQLKVVDGALHAERLPDRLAAAPYLRDL